MTLPKGVSSGHRMRLKGKGIAGGDQFVRLRIVLPEKIDKRMEELAAGWREHASFDPRKELRRNT